MQNMQKTNKLPRNEMRFKCEAYKCKVTNHQRGKKHTQMQSNKNVKPTVSILLLLF